MLMILCVKIWELIDGRGQSVKTLSNYTLKSVYFSMCIFTLTKSVTFFDKEERTESCGHNEP